MTRTMALELAPHGIRVNAIALGLTDTAQPRYGHDEEELELAAMACAVPLGRMAGPADHRRRRRVSRERRRAPRHGPTRARERRLLMHRDREHRGVSASDRTDSQN